MRKTFEEYRQIAKNAEDWQNEAEEETRLADEALKNNNIEEHSKHYANWVKLMNKVCNALGVLTSALKNLANEKEAEKATSDNPEKERSIYEKSFDSLTPEEDEQFKKDLRNEFIAFSN